MTKKRILFRADGNSETGLGHLYRLFALVEVYKSHFEYCFVTQASSSWRVVPKEYNLNLIPESISIKDEPEWLSNRFNSSEHIIVADGYHFDSGYQRLITEAGFNLMYIDDLVKEEMYADIVVNHSVGITEKNYKSKSSTIFALGTEYTILRPLFLERAKKRKHAKVINSLFVCFGGSDFFNLTNICVKGALQVDSIERIHAVLGEAYKHIEIFNTVANDQGKVKIHRNLAEAEILNLMEECQLAILPTSTICYEACAVKLAIIGGYYVDNQKNIYNGLVANDIIYPAGDFTQLSDLDYKTLIQSVLNDPLFRHQQKLDKQKFFFDGKQKSRFQLLIEKIV
ncbi:UDP-2,4-diacetamido-2,4,6-trideoxy-beta-L-altropyranose hydrolase [Ulvibacterium marinum]|uniref:UDP-2,4-diacetamido-2,4, 6-trideoxy-beta-L-altropyranose hydrolase n=1 Tax=Ulvibacterium marinum TaxID=2419782 RepID=A0A3B0CA71_9FLAO|nr:UDP-2,4-diacetamido-2,4,6-trideoxy-beta-L-altropyranose hydrolase [Ulvibacterium marinum]RKN82772.1 UDP-2,4-diacetamido-2,4,6-trideoxy-beta-L-altropyranose hydrolase [Ulvibacterium marinum]